MDHEVGGNSQELGSYTIDEWCRLRRVSQRTFFRSIKDNSGPATYTFRGRRYVSADADRAWLAARERAA